jgi:hypothetical protein
MIFERPFRPPGIPLLPISLSPPRGFVAAYLADIRVQDLDILLPLQTPMPQNHRYYP